MEEPRALGFTGQDPPPAKKSDGCLVIGTALGVFVLGVLILLPNFLKPKAMTQLTACKSNCKNIATALEMYACDNRGRYPVDCSLLRVYLKTVPTCPVAGKDTYSETYQWHSMPDRFTFHCQGSHHSKVTPENYPKYSSEMGLTDGL